MGCCGEVAALESGQRLKSAGEVDKPSHGASESANDVAKCGQ